MIVKVCGVRDEAVAAAAVEAGADWIGLVFVPRSPRYADDAAARRVARAVGGGADLIGVLVSPGAAECDELAERHGIAAVQVHGEVAPELVEQCSVPVIRAINVRSRNQALTLRWWPDALVHLDAGIDDPAELPGGTGRPVPLEWAAEVARHRRIILAGGLTPETVAAAVAAVRPEGVDASSGLESAPGVKDIARVQQFVRNAREAVVAA